MGLLSLSEHFTYSKLCRFTFPSIVMMIFTSVYGVVDGIFVSNFVGKTPFAAVNLIMPFVMVFGAIGFMIGSGGSALVSKTLGEGNTKRANELFSMLVYLSILLSVVLSVVAIVLMEPIAILLGAEGEMVGYCVTYGRILMTSLTPFVLQYVFQSFFITAERPTLGLLVTVAAGLTNITLDAVFVAGLNWGLEGAAAATVISQFVGAIIPLVYFRLPNTCTLKLTRAKFDAKAIFQTCTNGSSELMSSISGSVVSMLYNFQLIRLAGEDGVAAYGAVMYVSFIFAAIFIGYAIGSAPVISFHYGVEHKGELRSLLHKSTVLNGLAGAAMAALAIAVSAPLSKIFVGYDQELCALTVRGFRLYAISYLLCGFNIFGSSFFTALNNGLASAVISFLRTLIFQCASVLILPVFLKMDGVWLAISVAEIAALAVTVILLGKNRKVYGY